MECFPDEVLDAPPKQHPVCEWQPQPDGIPEPPTKKQCCGDLRDSLLEVMAKQRVTENGSDNDRGVYSPEDQVLLHAEDCAVAAPAAVTA